MSDYFDGLMRSSGLALGTAPVIGPAARAFTPPMEIAVTVPAAPSAATDTAQVASLALPTQPGSLVAATTAPASTPAELGSTPALTKPGPAPRIEVADPTAVDLAPTASPGPANPAPTASLPPSLREQADAPAITRERVIEAAMRWVAAGPSDTPAEPDIVVVPAPGQMEMVEPKALPATAMPLGTPAAVREANVAAPTEPRRVPQSAEPEARSPAHAAAMPLPFAAPQSRGDAMQVSIGAIHLRVDAPAPPAVAATPAPPPSRFPAAAPRSGLSRRALRRL